MTAPLRVDADCRIGTLAALVAPQTLASSPDVGRSLAEAHAAQRLKTPSTASRIRVITSETSSDPAQPRRLEKKTNIAAVYPLLRA